MFSRQANPSSSSQTPASLIAGYESGASNSVLSTASRRRKLALPALLALSLVVGLTGVSQGPVVHNPVADVSATRCVACFAAPIAPAAEAAETTPQALLTSYGNVALYQSETWDALTSQNIESAITLLPASVRNELGNPALGQVLVTVNAQGRTVSGRQPYGGPANFFSTNENYSQVVLYPDQSVRTVLHELGHAYNLRRIPAGSYGKAYLDPELLSFMEASSWRLITPSDQLNAIRSQEQVSVVLDGASPWTNLSRNDPLEDFANSFALFFLAPSDLQSLSPARYDWFATHFN